MCVCVCVYVGVCLCVHVCLCERMFVCVQARMCVRMYECMYTLCIWLKSNYIRNALCALNCSCS